MYITLILCIFSLASLIGVKASTNILCDEKPDWWQLLLSQILFIGMSTIILFLLVFQYDTAWSMSNKIIIAVAIPMLIIAPLSYHFIFVVGMLKSFTISITSFVIAATIIIVGLIATAPFTNINLTSLPTQFLQASNNN